MVCSPKKSSTCRHSTLVGWPRQVGRGAACRPYGLSPDPNTENIKIGGHAYRGQARLYLRHLKTNPHAAFVVDDSLPSRVGTAGSDGQRARPHT